METTKHTADQELVEVATQHNQHVRFPKRFLPKICSNLDQILHSHTFPIFLICCVQLSWSTRWTCDGSFATISKVRVSSTPNPVTAKPRADPHPASKTRGTLQRPLGLAAARGGDGEVNRHGEPLSASSPHVLGYWDIQHLELLCQTELQVRGKVRAVLGIA